MRSLFRLSLAWSLQLRAVAWAIAQLKQAGLGPLAGGVHLRELLYRPMGLHSRELLSRLSSLVPTSHEDVEHLVVL